MKRKSTRHYTAQTIKLLWGRAAGRCAVPTCRVSVIADETDYDPAVPIGEIAHIEASSDGGPRASRKLPPRERDKYENLILLCAHCHGRFDTQARSHSVAEIRKLKTDHEEWVRKNLPERGRSTTGWRMLLLAGDHPIDRERARAALSPDYPAGRALAYEVGSSADWVQTFRGVTSIVRQALHGGDGFDRRIAVFPLAPVSACVAMGYMLTSRPNVRLFQHYRSTRTWAWPSSSLQAADLSVTGIPRTATRRKGDVALCFHLSATICRDDIRSLKLPLIGRVDIRAANPSTDWLRHEQQLRRLEEHARHTFESCLRAFPGAQKWHLFYCGPAPGAVAVGQQISPTMCPPVQLYEFSRHAVPAHKPSILLRPTR